MKQLIALMILTAGLTFADPPEALVMNYSSEFLARLWSMIPGVPLHAPGFVHVLITPHGGTEDSYRVTVIPPSGKAQQVTVMRAAQGVTLAASFAPSLIERLRRPAPRATAKQQAG